MVKQNPQGVTAIKSFVRHHISHLTVRSVPVLPVAHAYLCKARMQADSNSAPIVLLCHDTCAYMTWVNMK